MDGSSALIAALLLSEAISSLAGTKDVENRSQLLHLLLQSSSASASTPCLSGQPRRNGGKRRASPLEADKAQSRVVEAMMGSFDPLVEHLKKANSHIFPPRRRKKGAKAKLQVSCT